MWRGKSSYAITMSVQVVGGRGLKTVELSSYRVYRAKLSSNRTIEYIEQNCPAIEHLLQSCRVIEHIEHVLQNPTKNCRALE